MTAPAQPRRRARRRVKGGPATVGDGADYSAVVTGKISKATGTFTNVSPKITEKGQIGGVGPKKANEFSLQLNTQFFSGSPACAKAGTPSKCLAWQQFVYTTDSNIVFMQYWLIDYDAKCLSGWIPGRQRLLQEQCGGQAERQRAHRGEPRIPVAHRYCEGGWE